MSNLGDLDGQFEFYAIVTPEGKIPTVDHDHHLNDPSTWYTSPIGTHAHFSDFTLVFNEWEDAKADYQHFKAQLPAGSARFTLWSRNSNTFTKGSRITPSN